MKKFLALIALTLCFAVSNAQSTSPRFGTTPSKDNTGRVATYGYSAPTQSSTLVFTPKYSYNVYSVQGLTVSPTINFTVTSSYVGDMAYLLIGATSASRTVTFAGGVKSAGTFTLGSGKVGSATFIFNGTNYVEVGRYQEQ